MKNKLLAGLLPLLAFTSNDLQAAQATVMLNNYDAAIPIYYRTVGTLAPMGQQISAELLGGPVGGAMNPVKVAGSANSIIPLSEAGYFDGGCGVVTGVTPGGQAQFVLRAWKGPSPYATATEKAESATWTQATGTWNDLSVPPSPPSGPTMKLPAYLLVQTQPAQTITITSQPADAAVDVLGTATFRVAATGTGLTYQWKKDDQPLAGATSATLTLGPVQIAQRGVYSCAISGTGGASATSRGATLTVRMVEFVRRQLQSGAAPGQKITVSLDVSLPANLNVAAYAVEDIPPAGWVVGTVNEGGSVSGGKVRFGAFFDAATRTLTYELTVPVTATASATFAGSASAEGLSSVVGGASTLNIIQYHPADNNPSDWKITMDEVTAYGAAWKRGQAWTVPPTPIPITYVTRAVALWKANEAYRVNPAVTSAPLWWEPTAGMGSFVGSGLRHITPMSAPGDTLVADQTPNKYVPNVPFKVALVVKPTPAAAGYAVEEKIPDGWEPLEINENGSLDTVNQMIKWGPFLDAKPRTLAYQLMPPKAAKGPMTFQGTASIDGQSIPIDSVAHASSKIGQLRLQADGGVEVPVAGVLGAKYNIEASNDLGQTWEPVTSVINENGSITASDPNRQRPSVRIYRAVLVE